MHLKGTLVNVFTEDVYPVAIEFNQNIVSVREIKEEQSHYILPGFIDSHIHIESSLLCPSRFAQAVVPHGTTCTVSDPHEIANVMGVDGITYMMQDTSVLKVFYTAPSCVPATAFETAGAVVDAHTIHMLFEEYDLVALGEVMNFVGVINGDKDIMAKIAIAQQYKKVIDGHAPGLSGDDLQLYLNHGIGTDHECVSLKEAEEKQRLGVKIMLREGTASKNVKDLIGLHYDNCFLVSDDLHPEDIKKGHIDILLKKAVSYGIDPIKAIKMVTINPAEHYRLPTGAIAPGRAADMVVVDNLCDFSVKKVFIDGVLVAENQNPLFTVEPTLLPSTFAVDRKTPDHFHITHDSDTATVRVISLVKEQLLTKAEKAVLPCEQGEIVPDTLQDVIKVAVVERYGHNNIGVGFVKGFGLKSGALASSVAHDSHNIIAVGVTNEMIARAVNTIIDMNGGITACGDTIHVLPLPVAGLMSPEPVDTVVEQFKKVQNYAKTLGCTLPDPFMQLSFLALLVIPELKLSDKGLFDSKRFTFVDVVL
jgi:adenine deaminase